MIRRRAGLAFGLALLAAVSALAQDDLAQDDPEAAPEEFTGSALEPAHFAIPRGFECEPDEWDAFQQAVNGRYVRARELAEKITRERPRSAIGHFVLGYVLHYGEANFPRALFEMNQAIALYEARYGRTPREGVAPARWHAVILRELAQVHGDLDHHAEKVAYLERHNRLYEPKLLAERAWPLMKMGKHALARKAAQEGIASGDTWQREVALNALCAIEFEAGDDGASYAVCREAMEEASLAGTANAVDLTNFAEASRSVFKLEEAERVLLDATRADVAWYGNPWMELAELYLREGRFAESLSALHEIPAYRAQRPAYVRDADRNETRRVLSEFFLAVGRAEDALRITEKALEAPDRRAHNSRDPEQDLAMAALLDRRARLMSAERIQEDAAAAPDYERAWAWFRATGLRLSAWMSGRKAARAIADDERLVGIFRIGTARGAILPPWLAGDLIEIVGPGVVTEAIRRARSQDHRAQAAAYYDAFEAEASLHASDPERAYALASRASERLLPAEALLRARNDMILSLAASDRGRGDVSNRALSSAIEKDPGAFRRLGIALPVRVEGLEVDRSTRDLALALFHSPRFEIRSDAAFVLRIGKENAALSVCLLRADGTTLGCGRSNQGPGATLLALHNDVFSPRIDLTQADANGLDGSTALGRDPLRGLRGEPIDPFEP